MQLITMKERRVETITIYRLHDLKESDNKDLFQKTEGVRELRGYRKKRRNMIQKNTVLHIEIIILGMNQKKRGRKKKV